MALGLRNGKIKILHILDTGRMENGLDKEVCINNHTRKGYGVQCYTDGSKYDGMWKKDKRHGNGKMRYSDGSIYDGTWRKNKRSGKGTMLSIDGSVYTGDWENDVKCGQGLLKTGVQDIYEGSWRNDVKHGEGTYFSQVKGSELRGVWQRDIPCCGTYEIVNLDAATSPMMYDIPKCTLKDPENVIENSRVYYMERISKDAFEK